MAKTIREAAQDLGLHPNTIRRAIRQGQLVGVKVRDSYGEKYLIEQEELDKFRHTYYNIEANKGRVMIKVSGEGQRQGDVRGEAREFYERLLKEKDEHISDLKTELDRLSGLLALPPKRPAGASWSDRWQVIAGLAVFALAFAGLLGFLILFPR